MPVEDREARSRAMAKIHVKDTAIEILVRKRLFHLGFRYKVNDRSLPGKPDIVFPKYRAVIFVHGCFWHGHDCSLFRLPKTNRNFWKNKIASNRLRDRRVMDALRDQNWRVGVIWECAIRGMPEEHLVKVMEKTAFWLKSNEDSLEIRR